MSILRKKYYEEMVPGLKEKLSLSNPHRIPRCSKVVINMGVGVAEKDTMKAMVSDLTAISGQRPVVTSARKSISNFKLREGMEIGVKVTLRGDRMYEFLERLIGAALPRIRDFRGVPRKAFDGNGNYTLGIREQTIFPEIDPNNASVVQGMNVTIVTTAVDDNEGRELLDMMGMPFADEEKT